MACKCNLCKGSGKCKNCNKGFKNMKPCPYCNAKGICPRCNGSGLMKD